MNPWVAAIGLCFVVPSAGYAGMILSRRFTWPAVEGKVFRVKQDKAEIKLTYVVGGRSRTAVKKGWVFGTEVGDLITVRYDPDLPFRYQVERPVLRPLCMLGLALAAGCGALIIAASVTGPRADEGLDLPWLVSMGLGLVVFAIGGAGASYCWKRRGWREAAGTITNVRESKYTDSDGGTSVTYTVAYKFVDEVHEVSRRTETDTWFRRHEQGQELTVRYDPEDPDRSDLSTPRQRLVWWASAAALLVLGSVFFVLGLLDASAG